MGFTRAVILIATLGAALAAQPAPRPLGPTVGTYGLNAWGTSLHELSDGRVLVVDSLTRLVLLDSSLHFVRVVIDSIPSQLRTPASMTGSLIPTPDGGALYVDGKRNMFAVIDAKGDVESEGHPLPRPDVTLFRWLWGGRTAADPAGRLIYAHYPTRGPINFAFGDTAFLIAVDPFAPAYGDPQALPAKRIVALYEPRVTDSGALRPVQTNDAWAVVPRGIVILRAESNRAELRTFDGDSVFARPIDVPRIALSIEEKKRLVDSTQFRVRQAAETLRTAPHESVITNVQTPERLPDVRPSYWMNSLVAGANGTVWFIENRPYHMNDSTVAQAIDPGSGLATVDRLLIPPRMKILAFGKDAVYLWRPFGELTKVRIK